MLPRLIPWKSKNEWLKVYEDAYSGDYNKTKSAVKAMAEWRDFMRDYYRPGMDCTRGLLHVGLKDNKIFPKAEQTLEDLDLQLMYSAEIMRFLNMTGCSNKGHNNGKKISLYARAKELGIEDWVVNIRHQAAHQSSLPPLTILRMALRFILSWLQREYWEIEKAGMKEVQIEDSTTVLKENLTNLLHVYVSLKEQSILGFKIVKDIQDPDVKFLLSQVNSYSLTEVKARCKPWELKKAEPFINMNKFNNSLVTNAISNVLIMLKEYIICERIYGINTIDVLIDKMIDDSVDHSGMRKDVWNTLLRTIHSWYKFPYMIKAFSEKSYETGGERAYQAGMWCAQLCKALHKRFQVELLSEYLTKSFTFGKASGRKRINLNSSEVKELKKLIMKKKLNILDKSDNKIFACMLVRVEEKNPDLREVLRLKEPIFPEQWQTIDLLRELSFKPTDFTEQCLHSLYHILKWPFKLKNFNNIIALTRIYRGEGVPIKKGRRLYKVAQLQKAIESQCIGGVSIDDSNIEKLAPGLPMQTNTTDH